MFTCIVDFPKGQVPQYVTFKSLTSEQQSVTLPIDGYYERKQMYNLTICAHGSIRKKFSNTKALIEWFETYLMLGATKFAVYNHSGSVSLKPLIHYYVQRGVLDFYDISTPKDVSSPRDGQMVIIQDCIYRYMYQTKYLALIDFDEFFIPVTSTNIVSMLDSRTDKGYCGHFSLAKYWFCTDLPSTKDSLLASYTKRSNVSLAGKQIIQPQRILNGLVHNVIKLSGYKSCGVHPKDGYIHHYRKSDQKHQSNRVTEVVEDLTAFRFLGKLMPRLRRLFSLFPIES